MVQNNISWVKGLYDAEIVDVKKENYIYDYKQKNPTRNMFEIVIEANQAMNDTSIKSIRLYNYKVIAGSEDIVHAWWYEDEITEINGLKKLKLILRHSKGKFSEIIIMFDKMEIVR